MGGGAMKFGEFLEYVEKYDSGKLWKDRRTRTMTCCGRPVTRGCAVRSRSAASITMNYQFRLQSVSHVSASGGTARCRTRTIRECLLEWYVWRKLEGGEYRKWKYRTS
jgi:hypothetical protein